MMKCQDYIFQLTSGQLDSAGPLVRLSAFQHRLICHRCRAFTRNDRQLTQIVQDFRDHLEQPPADTDNDNPNT